jgi:hypothetical protein
MANNIVPLSLHQLFQSDKYVIPIYQRNYSWEEREIAQLIQDIADYAVRAETSHYYIGTLVVYERREGSEVLYETIDGQQRLTTLNILLSVLKHAYPGAGDFHWFKMNLRFDSRKCSTETLEALYSDGRAEMEDTQTAIRQGYADAQKALGRILNESGLKPNQFFDYLSNQVMILRVPVPPDTDLNHYFEIMNSRGEQLEKHEILKAQCLDLLSGQDELGRAFNLIWESCANMERYVQYGFDTGCRPAVFGRSWDEFPLQSLEAIAAAIPSKASSEIGKVAPTVEDILKGAMPESKNSNYSDGSERFTTVINFSNFLLHVLRIQERSDIPLDDKRLLEQFKPYLESEEEVAKDFVRKFGYNLLKCKFLFDNYIIKREQIDGANQWSLKRFRSYESGSAGYVNSFGGEDQREGDNRQIMMLLAMFHVSNPTLVYKHWLSASMKFLFEQEKVDRKKYRDYLETLAKAFIQDRFLTQEKKDYFKIIFENGGNASGSPVDPNLLNQGTDVENFVFNYLDYLLWKVYESEYSDFEYTFRSSVEHYYPQNPIGENPRIKDDLLHSFGNLCLISSGQNSRLSNYMPLAKRDHYVNSSSIDSIKQRIMMESKDSWGETEIRAHGEQMLTILLESLN